MRRGTKLSAKATARLEIEKQGHEAEQHITPVEPAGATVTAGAARAASRPGMVTISPAWPSVMPRSRGDRGQQADGQKLGGDQGKGADGDREDRKPGGEGRRPVFP